MKFDEFAERCGEWLRGSGPQSDIVISSRIRLARNLAEFPFIRRCTEQDRQGIERTFREAIQSVNDTPTVFGRYGGSFEARPVELGSSDGHATQIVKGLLPGERYAAKNSFLLKADLGKSGASHDH